MPKIETHPILEVPKRAPVSFIFDGKPVRGEQGFTIAAALHQAGYPIHSHSIENRERSLECGIGKCGACEMLVDGQIKRICITPVDGVGEVREIPREYTPKIKAPDKNHRTRVFKTSVAIIGAGPAGLAAREILLQHKVENIVIDNNSTIGGQFNMQTHQFFFFEKEKKYGGMRGFEIAKTLAGDNPEGIFLDSTVWDILEGKRIAVKNIKTDEIYYVEADHLIIATGAVPFMPTFENDDLPGVYTAAVVQKMMNQEFTLLGKNVLTVGAGNIGYLTSYQLMQAGARVKAIIEAMDHEGGFPVQANRVRRLGIPVLLSKILVKAVPNETHTGIVGAIIADCKDFKPIPGTEQMLEGIDAINICTGLVSDDQLLIKGNEIFGRQCHGAGDAIRIGEGTSAVLRGKQVAYEILQELAERFSYRTYLSVSKEYIDSQQEPTRILQEPFRPADERKEKKPFVIIDCLYGFACNPCEFACKRGAITKTSTSTVPQIDFDKCIGCMDCVYQCPGLAIFGYHYSKDWLFLPIEYEAAEGSQVFLVDNNGKALGEGVLEKILRKPNKTNVARVRSNTLHGDDLMRVRGFVAKADYPDAIRMTKTSYRPQEKTYVCHCDDVSMDEILQAIGDRKFISADEVKHTTRLGMGACRGKRCIKRLKTALAPRIQIVGDATPRGPLSNQISMGEIYPKDVPETYITGINGTRPRVEQTSTLVAGGGIGGSALFRYMAEAGLKPVLLNFGRGSSWRNIAGGRTAFSVPEISDIAEHNRMIFEELHAFHSIDYRPIHYVNFAHNEATLKALDASRAWSDAYMVEPKDFQKEISPFMNPGLTTYLAALITRGCWQATPGKVVDLLRKIGIEKGGTVKEDCELISVHRNAKGFIALVRDHNREYTEYHVDNFVNALGPAGEKYSRQLGLFTGIYAIKHQAFITRRLPWMGVDGSPLGMLIDRRNYKGFVAVYGQQLAETGQIIGCASPAIDPMESGKNLKINSQEFIEIASEVFSGWIPELSSVGFQAVWAGYYVEPRMYVDTAHGLFTGLRGQGFMLGMGLAKMYVDELMGRQVPDYFKRLSLDGDGLPEKAFK